MSAYHPIGGEKQMEFKNPRMLIKALEELGLTVQDHIGKPVTITNRWGETTQAEIVVKGHKFNSWGVIDFGFIRDAKGNYVPMISDVCTASYKKDLAKQLGQTYADKVLRQQMMTAGFVITGKKTVNNKVTYQFSRG
jgi:hypothetical protein